MDKEKHIKRGRDQMRIRLKGKGKGDESVHDLLKLPIEVLYTEALREIGEQEAYIDELKSTIKRLEGENKCLRGNVNSLSLQSQKDGRAIKREELYKQQNARNIKPKVVVTKVEDMTYPYDSDLTRTVYNYLADTKSLTTNWDVFNNAVMRGNYAQLDTPANAKANLCQIIHLFDIYICGGLYGHNAANSIGLSGRTNLTQQASNLPENFKKESEQIFRQWAKKQSHR